LAQSTTILRSARPSRHRGLHRLYVAALGVVKALGAADRSRRRQRDVGVAFDQPLDLHLDRVGELEAVRAKQLDAVVLVGIVRSRDHDADVSTHRAGQEADRGRRQRPEQQHVDADRQEACRQRLLDHVAAEARVLAHHDAMAMAAAIEDPTRGHTDAHGDLGRHRARVRAAPHPIGAEQ
jgi:hypothetical protein